MTTPPPVSWLLIEPGWSVVGVDGTELGRVEEVTGDSSADVFDGLSVGASATAHPKYVPSEQVGEIVEGRVSLRIDAAAFEQLGEFKEPPVQDTIQPEKPSLLQRADHAIAPPVERPERVGFVRRVLEWLGVAGRR
jgi:hypothetical protein